MEKLFMLSHYNLSMVSESLIMHWNSLFLVEDITEISEKWNMEK